MATLKEVADYVGVSITTVSRVYNNKGAIGKKTRKKVLKAMEELGYQPNELARSLQNQNSHLIGIIVPYLNHPIFSTLVDAATTACREAGYKVLLSTSEGIESQEKTLFHMQKNNNVAGVLVSTCIADETFYANCDLPIVSVERILPDVSCITCDSYMGGVQAAKELIKNGCSHICVLGRTVYKWMPGWQRYHGFLDTCSAANVRTERYFPPREEFSREATLAHVEELLQKHPDIDGIFSNDDVIALKLYHRANHDLNRRKPLLVATAFETRISQNFDISAISQPFAEEGTLAIEQLLKHINGSKLPTKTTLPTELCARASSSRTK